MFVFALLLQALPERPEDPSALPRILDVAAAADQAGALDPSRRYRLGVSSTTDSGLRGAWAPAPG